MKRSWFRYGGFVVGAAAVTAMIAWAPAVRSDSSGYSFSNVSASYEEDPVTGLADTSTARVTFDYAWATTSFPGQRLCTFTVFGVGGEPVGEETVPFTALASERQGASNSVPVSAPPASAEISCEGGRLDDSGGEFRFTNVGIERARSRGADSRPLVDVSFAASWTGRGQPATQLCAVEVYDAQGSLVAQDEFTLTSAARDIRGTRQIEAAVAADREPLSGRISCSEFSSD